MEIVIGGFFSIWFNARNTEVSMRNPNRHTHTYHQRGHNRTGSQTKKKNTSIAVEFAHILFLSIFSRARCQHPVRWMPNAFQYLTANTLPVDFVCYIFVRLLLILPVIKINLMLPHRIILTYAFVITCGVRMCVCACVSGLTKIGELIRSIVHVFFGFCLCQGSMCSFGICV